MNDDNKMTVSVMFNGRFVSFLQRINVMITRAIGLLIIIGHKETLRKNADWRKIIDYTYANCDGEMNIRFEVDGDDVDEYDYRC